MTTNDQTLDEVSECNLSLTSLFHSLTAPPTNHKKPITHPIRDIQPPSLISSDRRSLADVGNFLMNPDCAIGIDCIAVTFPFRNFIMDNPKDWEKGPMDMDMNRSYGKWTNRYPFPPDLLVGDVVFTAEVREGRGRGSFEIKPSTNLFGPKTLGLAEIVHALKVARLAYVTVGQWLELVQPFETLKLTRLDLTYDVDKVADVQRLLKRVPFFPHNNQVPIKPILKGKGRWESVAVRSATNGGFIVYDKTRQCKKGDSVVRFEANVRPNVLKKYCPSVDYLTEDSANTMYRHFFKKLITGLSQTTETSLEGPLSSKKYKLRTIEYAGIKLLQRAGHHVTLGSGREKSYRELERMGIGNAIEALLDNMV